jgi:hypothetical protein
MTMEVSSPLKGLCRTRMLRDTRENPTLAMNFFEIYTSSGRVIRRSEKHGYDDLLPAHP